MKNLWKKLYFTAGLLVTIRSMNEWLETKNAKRLMADFDSSMKELGLSDSSVRTLRELLVFLATLISWPLWIVQVILDLTINK